MHEPRERRTSRVRAEQIMAAGVEKVVTGCPYCLNMLEDGLGSREGGNPPRVWDLAELVLQSMG